MLELSGKLVASTGLDSLSSHSLWKVSTNRDVPKAVATKMAFLCDRHEIPDGYKVYLALARDRHLLAGISERVTAILPDSAAYIGHGDIIRLLNKGQYRVLYRTKARHHSVLLTERCNHYCLMCSQPPRDVN